MSDGSSQLEIFDSNEDWLSSNFRNLSISYSTFVFSRVFSAFSKFFNWFQTKSALEKISGYFVISKEKRPLELLLVSIEHLVKSRDSKNCYCKKEHYFKEYFLVCIAHTQDHNIIWAGLLMLSRNTIFPEFFFRRLPNIIQLGQIIACGIVQKSA